MNVVGIISEYNPFHNGHKYLIEKQRQLDPTSKFIAVMSGNFTQRGEISILNKWQRADLAILGGIDLVLELPTVFALRSAEYFALGGVSLLHKLNLVDTICFGSEYTNLTDLTTIAKASLAPDFSPILQTYIKQGLPYAAAMSKALNKYTNIAENIIKAPNTILGIEYIKAVIKMQASIKFSIIPRYKAMHNDLNYQQKFASGTAIRHALYQNDTNFAKLAQVVPNQTLNYLKQAKISASLPDAENLFLPLSAKLRLAKLTDINDIYGIREGLEFKLLEMISKTSSLDELLSTLKSKRYARTSLQRLLYYILLNLTKAQMANFNKNLALYARVLAFNDNGRQLLKRMKETSTIPIITKTSAYLDSKKRRQSSLTTLEEMLSIDTFASDLYTLCFNPIKLANMDFTTSPHYIKNASSAVLDECS